MRRSLQGASSANSASNSGSAFAGRGLPDGAVVGENIRGANEYFGPGAPPGPRYHHYVFELYALNTVLDLPQTAGRDELLDAMQGQIVAKAAYVGRFRADQ